MSEIAESFDVTTHILDLRFVCSLNSLANMIACFLIISLVVMGDTGVSESIAFLAKVSYLRRDSRCFLAQFYCLIVITQITIRSTHESQISRLRNSQIQALVIISGRHSRRREDCLVPLYSI